MSADIATVGRALPKAVADAQSWLTARTQETTNVPPWVPFLVAFGLIALVMSVLIVVNVVSGAVSAGIRRIGVLKSVGFLSQFVRPDRGPAMIQVLAFGGIFTILGLAADTLNSCASGAVGNWLAGCPRLLRSDRMLRQLLTSGSEPRPLWPAPRPASGSDHIRTTAPGKPAFRRRSSSYPSAAV